MRNPESGQQILLNMKADGLKSAILHFTMDRPLFLSLQIDF
jgi:hypothetical protein